MKFLLPLLLISISISLNAQPALVEANETKYNVLVKGMENRTPGSPVLILESGLGSELGNWNTVFDQLSIIAPVFAYDRSSIGKSGKNYKMPTAKHVAESLHTLLRIMKIAPPYVLVGHSLGGVYIRSFAGLYPADVAGLVFIDPADFTETKEDWNNIFRTMKIPEPKIQEMLQNRLYRPVRIDSANFGASGEGAVLGELRRNDFAEISALPLPKVPIIFFVGGKFEVPVERRSREYDQETFFHIKNNSNMDRWKKLMHTTGKPGSLIYLTNAGHYIHRDDPQSVIANIKIMLGNIK